MDSTAATNQNPVDVGGLTYHDHIMFAQLFKLDICIAYNFNEGFPCHGWDDS